MNLYGFNLNDQTDLFQVAPAETQEFYKFDRTLDDIGWGPLSRIVIALKSDLVQINRKT